MSSDQIKTRNFNSCSAEIIVVAAAFLIRGAWALMIPAIPLSDSGAYDALSRMLAEHGIYGWTVDQPSAYWPVGTSAIYALIYRVFGFQYGPIVIFITLLSCGIVGFTIWLGRIFFDHKTAIVAGALMAVWPSQVAYVTILGSELPFTFLIMLGIASWFSVGCSKLLRALTSGLAFGAAAYVRPIALLLPFVLWISSTGPSWRGLRASILVLIVSLAVIAVSIAPWSMRNSKLFGHFVLLSTNGGTNLWMGNNSSSNGFYMPLPDSTGTLNEYDRDKLLGEEASQFILAHPFSFIVRTLKKAALLHVGETVAVHWNAAGIKEKFGERALVPLKLLTQAFWSVMLLLALVGVGAMMFERGFMSTILHPIVAVHLYFTAVYAIFVIQDRYHFPSHPLVSILAAVGVLTLRARFHGVPISDREQENYRDAKPT